MNVLLDNAGLWPFAALVAVPLLLHLFARARPPPYQFSSIEFILRIIRKTMRIKRPQDWLLLAIRTLLFAAIILIFLQPVFFSKRQLAGPFQRKNVVLVVDATASMAYIEGGQSRFSAACAEASEVLSGLSSRDTANIVWLRASPEAVFPAMGSNLGYLRDALRRGRVTAEAGNVEEAFAVAARMLEGIEGKREICALSDFQKTVWENARFQVPAGIELLTVRVGRAQAENFALTDVYCEPAKPLRGEEITIDCEVRNYSPQPRQTTVFLNAGESRQSREVMVPAWDRSVAAFRYKTSEAGPVPVTASLTEDAFSGDDRRWAVVDVSSHLRVAILADEPGTAQAWRRALNALGWVKAETISRDDLAGALPYDAIMLSGWNGAQKENLRAKLTQGCAVVCFPARDLPASDVSALVGAEAQPGPGEILRWERSDTYHRVKIMDEKNPMFQLFAGGEYGNPARGTFRARMIFGGSAFRAGKVVLAYDDGVPALVELRKQGTLFVWNLPLDTEFSAWSTHAEFLPFIAEMLLTGRHAKPEHTGSTDSMPGEAMSWRPDREVILSEIALQDQDGKPVSIREQRTDRGIAYVSEEIRTPGLFTWQHRGKPVSYTAVNFPVIESDLRAMSSDMARQAGAVAVEGGRKVRQLRDGIKLWPQLLLLGLALALAEGVLLLWMTRAS